jgi:maltose alpha-D-glucosyltransferase/alpha-amylase
MQWSGDRNAGFSRVTPARLYSPVIMDPVYGYTTVNVEAQQSDPSSLLHWMRNLIALRKLFRVFGRGSMQFLETGNRKVLAYLRAYEGEIILCIANLSRFAQPIELDLSAFDGARPVEMLGYVEFPVISRRPYALTPGPYVFMWFELHTAEPVDVATDTLVLSAEAGWPGLLTSAQGDRLESAVLPRFLPHQRWFGGHGREIRHVTIRDWAELSDARSALVLLEVAYNSGDPEQYFVPLALTFEHLEDVPPVAVVCAVSSPTGRGVLHDAAFHEPTRAALFGCIADQRRLRARRGEVQGAPTAAFDEARGPRDLPLPAVRSSAEQSNTSFIYGDRLMLKLFRRQEPGLNPELEVGRYLTEEIRFPHIAAVAGTIDYHPDDGSPSTLALLQRLIPHQGDGWTWTLEELERYYTECSLLPPPDGDLTGGSSVVTGDIPAVPARAREHMGLYLEGMATLGRQTAELHLALAAPTADPAFRPEPLTTADLAELAATLQTLAGRMLSELRGNLVTLPDPVVDQAALVLSRRARLLASLEGLAALRVDGVRTRVHGDYHLGQVLRVKNEFAFLDFEGEPARTLAERRRKHSPLKDVAGMLRSFSYAAWVGLAQFTTRGPDAFDRLEPWARLWEQASSAAFLGTYLQTAGPTLLPREPAARRAVLEAYLLDKACYEVIYELKHRPAWVWIPLRHLVAQST